MTERTCDGYGLSVKGLEGVTFCRKAGAQIVGELVQDLRAENADLRSPDRWRLAEETAQGLLAIERGRTQQLEAQLRQQAEEVHAYRAEWMDSIAKVEKQRDELEARCRTEADAAMNEQQRAMVAEARASDRLRLIKEQARQSLALKRERVVLKAQLAAVSLSLHQNTEGEETPCLKREDKTHCVHWYDGDRACCACGDDTKPAGGTCTDCGAVGEHLCPAADPA